jgi:hypothetical protein
LHHFEPISSHLLLISSQSHPEFGHKKTTQMGGLRQA